MAANILNLEVSELCLGKPAIRWISAAATIAEALAALKTLAGETSLSVWTCNCASEFAGNCRCVGKVSVSDVVCFLAREDNFVSPATALQAPISDLLPKSSCLVKHLEPNASFLEAIDAILGGATNIVIPIESFWKKKKKNTNKNNHTHNGKEYCWISQEDIIRYLLNCIGLFSRTAATSLTSLSLISPSPAVLHLSPAASALPLLTAVAVIDDEGRLIGEISRETLESEYFSIAAAAMAVLTAGEMAVAFPAEGLVRERLEERGHVAALDWLEEEEEGEESEGLVSMSSTGSNSSMGSWSSSEEEYSGGVRRRRRRGSKGVRKWEAVVCRPGSSLAAAMIQALAHRSGYVWVVEEGGKLVGVVTFVGMLKVFRERLNSMS